MRRTSLVVLVCLSVVPALPSGAAGMRYTLDPSESHVQIHVGKAGLMKFAGHEHTVVAPLGSGSAVVDASNLAASSVNLTFASNSLRVTAAGEPAGDAPKVQQAMLGPQCLDAARYPEIRFVSTAVRAGGGKPGHSAQVQGRLTIHGVTREVTVPVEFTAEGDGMSASGSFRIRQKDFGIQPISVAGVVKVKDELTLDFRLIGRRAAGG